jgi:hypothetical protein
VCVCVCVCRQFRTRVLFVLLAPPRFGRTQLTSSTCVGLGVHLYAGLQQARARTPGQHRAVFSASAEHSERSDASMRHGQATPLVSTHPKMAS